MSLNEKKENRVLGLNRNVFFMGLVSLFNDFSNEMIQSVMPAFLTITLGASPAVIGLIEGLADAASSILRIFSGWLSDCTGKRKKWAMLGYLISIIVRPLYVFVSTFQRFMAIRIVDRVGKGMRESPRDALIAESTEEEEVGKSFGYHRAMDAIGGIAGPAAAIIVLSLTMNNYKTLFFVAFGVGLLALLSFVFIRDVKTHPYCKMKVKFNFGFFKENPGFSEFLLAIFVFGIGTLPITLMIVRSLEVSPIVEYSSLMYLVYSLTFVILSIPIGKLSDKRGERAVISVGFIAAIFSYLILGFTNSILSLIVAFVLFGVYSAATDGIERALASKLLKRESLATGQGYLHATVGLSSLFAGLIGGMLWTKIGSTYAFLYATITAVMGLTVFLIISFGRHKK